MAALPSEPTRRRRILIAASRYPAVPLHDGYLLHLWHLVVELARHHHVELLVPHAPPGAAAELAGVDVTSVGRRLRNRDIESAIQRFEPHVVHLIGAKLAHRWRAVESIPSVLGVLDASHLNVVPAGKGLFGMARTWSKRRLILWRIRNLYRRFERVVVVSEQDRNALLREDSRMETAVIPNGVDLSAYASVPGIEREPGRLMFTGALGYPPNVATALFLAHEVMPHVRRRVPAARLALVGRDPSPSVEACAALPGVDVVGAVDNMAESLSAASVYVCPMVAGTGIKNKLLEALANGIPCVANGLAVQGTELQDGLHVLLAETAEEVAAAASHLLEDADARQRLGEAGLSYVARRHTWSGMADRYSEIYEAIICAAAAGRGA